MRKTLLSLALLILALPIAGFGAAGDATLADAAMNRDFTAVQALVNQKTDVNLAQPDGSTALHWAVYWTNLQVTDLLIKAGADIKAATRLGVTPLYLACETANAPMISRLLAAGANPNETYMPSGETPLMLAARSGNVESVRMLLDAGAKMEAKETLRETTALLWAAEQNNASVVALLLARGADARAASKVVVPPARGGGDDDDAAAGPALPPEANARGGLTALMQAVREKGVDSVKALLDAGAPIDQQAGDGTTALHIALQNGDAAMAQLLVDRGADVNLATMKGWNPLYLAVKARTLEKGTMPNPYIDTAAMFGVIKSMVEKGADPNARVKADTEIHNAIAATWLREAGGTPFLRAALCADLEVMKLLLVYGADPSLATNDGTNALMALAGVGYAEGFMFDFGSQEQSLDAMRLLINFGIDVNARNSDKVAAIHGAAHKNFVKGIELLVENGADLTARSQRASNFERKGTPGNTALDWATGVQVGMQSSIYHPEAVATVTRLMTERNLPIEALSNTKGGRAVQK